jgi:uncharacterized radical SAM superfamily protein
MLTMKSSVEKAIDCYYPGKSFPAISVTGKDCALDCKHCARRYLEGMVPATSTEELLEVARTLSARGTKGFLLSGGVDETGKVPIADFLPAIKEIKATTRLRINAHIGLSPTAEIVDLVQAGIDAFSVDIYGANSTIRDVLGLQASVDDYFRVLRDLIEQKAYVVPHICVGIHAGKVDGELSALETLSEFEPQTLVLISLIPTRGTAYQNVEPPSKDDMLMVVKAARRLMPRTRILLGCMRSRSNRATEYEAVMAGVDGIVLPSLETVKRLEEDGFSIRIKDECCAFP